MNSKKPTKKPAPVRAPESKPKTPGTVASPFEEMGAEDESADDARQAGTENPPPEKAPD